MTPRSVATLSMRSSMNLLPECHLESFYSASSFNSATRKLNLCFCPELLQSKSQIQQPMEMTAIAHIKAGRVTRLEDFANAPDSQSEPNEEHVQTDHLVQTGQGIG